MRPVIFCPQCVKHRTRSRSIVINRAQTSRNVEKFYDEEGVYHEHNPNVHVTHLRCDPYGHVFTVEDPVADCECGWVADYEVEPK